MNNIKIRAPPECKYSRRTSGRDLEAATQALLEGANVNSCAPVTGDVGLRLEIHQNTKVKPPRALSWPRALLDPHHLTSSRANANGESVCEHRA
jgi:hypothetical protein